MTESTSLFDARLLRRVTLCVAAASLAAACLTGCGQAPQLGGDPESLDATDGLWTAVCAKRSDLLDKCAQRIEAMHTESRLPDDAYQSLASVVETARGGDWASARASLKVFIQGQRRPKEG